MAWFYLYIGALQVCYDDDHDAEKGQEGVKVWTTCCEILHTLICRVRVHLAPYFKYFQIT